MDSEKHINVEFDEKIPMLRSNNKDNLKIIMDDIPTNVKFTLEPLSRELEKVSDDIYSLANAFFDKPDNTLEYGLLVVKVMEFVENIKKLKGKDKYIIAVRCIIKVIKITNSIPEDTKNDLIQTIPGSIKAIIQLTKGEPINRNIKGIYIVESVYVTKRAIKRILEFIEIKQYNLDGILENVFMIVTQIMYVVGSYPSLNGLQKKNIVIKVITYIITKYTETETGKKIPESFAQMILDSVPSMIDILVAVSRGKFNININKIKKYLSSCCPCC